MSPSDGGRVLSAGSVFETASAGSDCKGAGDNGSTGTGEGACTVLCSSGTSCISSTTSGFFRGLPRLLPDEGGTELGSSSAAFLFAPLLDEDDAGVASTAASDPSSFPAAELLFLVLEALGVAWVLVSEGGSSIKEVFFRGRPGVPFFAGDPARFFEVALGTGVGAYFLGRPLFRGVVTDRVEKPSSSLASRRGMVVVVVCGLRRTVGDFVGLDDGNRRRRTSEFCCWCSDSTVTKSFCGDLLSPTSREKVCLRGETLGAPSDMNFLDCWLRVMRRIILEGMESLRGSGEDIDSSSDKVAMVGCRCWAGPQNGMHAVSRWRRSSRSGAKDGGGIRNEMCFVKT